MKSYEVISRRKVTSEQIDNVLTDAFESGIGYWCDKINVIPGKDGKEFDGYASEAITRNHAVNIHDAEGERWRKLTLKRMIKAIAATPGFDFEQYDALDADALVQKALFGEVVYG